MNEIEVGEYCRTKDGIITKVTYVDELMIDCDRDVFDLGNLAMMEIPTEYVEEYITKHNKNIIDLIEENDIGIMEYRGLTFRKFITKDDILELKFGNYKLLEILTKEQYKQNSYVVKE